MSYFAVAVSQNRCKGLIVYYTLVAVNMLFKASQNNYAPDPNLFIARSTTATPILVSSSPPLHCLPLFFLAPTQFHHQLPSFASSQDILYSRLIRFEYCRFPSAGLESVMVESVMKECRELHRPSLEGLIALRQ